MAAASASTIESSFVGFGFLAVAATFAVAATNSFVAHVFFGFILSKFFFSHFPTLPSSLQVQRKQLQLYMYINLLQSLLM